MRDAVDEVMIAIEWVGDQLLRMEGYGDFDSYDECAGFWGRLIDLTDADDHPTSKNPWARGNHLGDCVGFPMACTTCLIDGQREDARQFMAGYQVQYEDEFDYLIGKHPEDIAREFLARR